MRVVSEDADEEFEYSNTETKKTQNAFAVLKDTQK